MNLQLFTNLIAEYRFFIGKREESDWQQPWKSVEVFTYHWDIEARDFATMYDDSFAGDNYLWEDDDFHPKVSMLHYAKQNPDLIRSLFIDLYDEGRDIVGRIHRFIDQCDQLRTYHSKGITKREAHYHADRRMVFVYLAFRYPEKYTLYEELGFRKLLERVNAKSLGSTIVIERYIKTSRTIDTLMRRDETLIHGINKALLKNSVEDQRNVLHVSDFYRFVDTLA
ncbi:MAG: hypothetical protein ACJA01_004293 [Saprospiraceae bacterium]|jgi:hypothetical protein